MPNDRSPIDPQDYRALMNFFRAYLHQDAAPIHGSPTAAAQAFRRDADEREAAIVHGQLERLLEETAQFSDSELSQVIESLGSSWHFTSRHQIEQVLHVLK